MVCTHSSTPACITITKIEYVDLLATVKRQEEEIAALEFRIKSLLGDQ